MGVSGSCDHLHLASGSKRILGGSWVVISKVISPLIWVIPIVTLPITMCDPTRTSTPFFVGASNRKKTPAPQIQLRGIVASHPNRNERQTCESTY